MLGRSIQVAPTHRTDPSFDYLAGSGSHYPHGTTHAHPARAAAASRYVEFAHVAHLRPFRIIAVVDGLWLQVQWVPEFPIGRLPKAVNFSDDAHVLT